MIFCFICTVLAYGWAVNSFKLHNTYNVKKLAIKWGSTGKLNYVHRMFKNRRRNIKNKQTKKYHFVYNYKELHLMALKNLMSGFSNIIKGLVMSYTLLQLSM